AENVDRMIALTGESLVTARELAGLSGEIGRVRRKQAEVVRLADELRRALADHTVSEHAGACLEELVRVASQCHTEIGERLADLDAFDRTVTGLAGRLYHEALGT